ncbi:hypothetical protein GCK72_021504 [Caenorhabditis remanei]|uniref:Uncharacterized protein n=1 Tax=Caenorhabditis remanei TaxID=31234 RepID=A0A6A5GKS7_CAERE|nr:hypothetical protein GCK72_021504 [Caenorhabditis remanei]KAF1754939.1 hypothetical protein GCK72_021504 [Caenorhabditis remanei]
MPDIESDIESDNESSFEFLNDSYERERAIAARAGCAFLIIPIIFLLSVVMALATIFIIETFQLKSINRAYETEKFNRTEFKNIKCLEDIPEEIMSKWTPDEWEFRGVEQFILDKSFDEDVHWFLRKAHPLLTKLSEDYQMQFQWVKEELALNSILLEGPCVYTVEDGSTKVFVKEGLLYVKSKYSYKKEKKEFTLVYSIPKGYQ